MNILENILDLHELFPGDANSSLGDHLSQKHIDVPLAGNDFGVNGMAIAEPHTERL